MLLKKLIKNLSPEKKIIQIRGLAIDSKKLKKVLYFFLQLKGINLMEKNL